MEEILTNLHNQFCGCTHVEGSIEIDMFGHDGYTNLTEDSFNSLYHVEEISGVLRFQNIPSVDRIVLPTSESFMERSLLRQQKDMALSWCY